MTAKRLKLSDAQWRVLRLMRKAGCDDAHRLHRCDIGTGLRPVHYQTLESLRDRGFVSGIRGGEWTLTGSGSDAVELWTGQGES